MLTPTTRALIARMRAEILADMDAGRIPRDVGSFAALHDHVDANCYGGLCDDPMPFDPASDADADIINTATAAVDAWLRTLDGSCALYRVLHVTDNDGVIVEDVVEYAATSLAEALTMAERADAGTARYRGIMAEDYAEALAEDIAFNAADGLLL